MIQNTSLDRDKKSKGIIPLSVIQLRTGMENLYCVNLLQPSSTKFRELNILVMVLYTLSESER